MAAELSSPLAPTGSVYHGLEALDLGSGPCPAPGYVGVDLCVADAGSSSVLYCDLFEGNPWPFESGSIERLRASHVIEHIPHERVVVGTTRVTRRILSPHREPITIRESIGKTQEAFFWFFDEAYRIAKPGCRFELAWPHPQSDAADQDPTHTRRIPVSTLHYLSRQGRRTLGVHHYPVDCDWVVEPGSVMELASDEALSPFVLADGSIDIAAAKRAHGVFHEIRAVLVKV